MKWIVLGLVIIVLAVPALFAWVYYLAFAHAIIKDVNVIPAILFVIMCLGAWTILLNVIDIANDWVASRASVDIAQTQGEVAEGIRSGVKLQREQALALEATARAINTYQKGGQGPQPTGGLSFDED